MIIRYFWTLSPVSPVVTTYKETPFRVLHPKGLPASHTLSHPPPRSAHWGGGGQAKIQMKSKRVVRVLSQGLPFLFQLNRNGLHVWGGSTSLMT
jgi:hypothetical protein